MKLFQIIFQTALVFIAVTILAAIIISLLPFQEYTFKEQPYPVINKQLKAGDTLQIKADYCKLSNARGEIDIIFEGANQYLTHTSFQAPKGCVNTVLKIPTPKDLSPGFYHFHGHGEYTKWLFGKAKVDTYTEQFEIIK